MYGVAQCMAASKLIYWKWLSRAIGILFVDGVFGKWRYRGHIGTPALLILALGERGRFHSSPIPVGSESDISEFRRHDRHQAVALVVHSL